MFWNRIVNWKYTLIKEFLLYTVKNLLEVVLSQSEVANYRSKRIFHYLKYFWLEHLNLNRILKSKNAELRFFVGL